MLSPLIKEKLTKRTTLIVPVPCSDSDWSQQLLEELSRIFLSLALMSTRIEYNWLTQEGDLTLLPRAAL